MGASRQDMDEAPTIQLGDCIGKGAFGSVYSGLNLRTGEVVAIKQIKLANMPKSDLALITTEIDLLKELNHPNIVQYNGSLKLENHLNIIMEYCENGSLLHIVKKYGNMPEALVAVYTAQILEGLHYLHEQGVMHRDIKAANILTTKSGQVKLADFGIACKVESMEKVVVGSPYWMAPEVIDLLGASTASDIWSLGCTIIELLQGHPPYYQLAAMTALFRIVQDDHPPIPEGCSSFLKDFLLECFQKDANLRISAKKLLKHPWILDAKKRIKSNQSSTNGSAQKRATDSTSSHDQKLKRTASTAGKSSSSDLRRKASNASKTHKQTEGTSSIRSVSKQSSSTDLTKKSPTSHAGATAKRKSTTQKDTQDDAPERKPTGKGKTSNDVLDSNEIPNKYIEKSEESDEDWDAMFDEEDLNQIIPKKGMDFNGNNVNDLLTKLSKKNKTSIPTMTQPLKKSVSNTSSLGLNDTKKSGASSTRTLVSSSAQKSPNSSISSKQSSGLPPAIGLKKAINGISDGGRPLTASSSLPKPIKPSSSKRLPITGGKASKTVGASTLPKDLYKKEDPKDEAVPIHLKYMSESDMDETDYNKDFDYDDNDGFNDGKNPTEKLLKKIKSINGNIDNQAEFDDEMFEEEDDPFADIVEDEIDIMTKDKQAKISNLIDDFLKTIQNSNPKYSDEQIKVCSSLLEQLTSNETVSKMLITHHCVIPLLEALGNTENMGITPLLLRIINRSCLITNEFQENICLLGGIPTILKFTDKTYSFDLRKEAAIFVRDLCSSENPLTLQMFIACNGIPIFIKFLQSDYNFCKELQWISIDGINQVLELKCPTPKNDFCRMFVKEGLFTYMYDTLYHINADRTPQSTQYAEKLSTLLLTFSTGDSYVKRGMVANSSSLNNLITEIIRLPPGMMLDVLKCIKNISMDSETLGSLYNADILRCLVTLMEFIADGSAVEIENQIAHMFFNLCRISRERQESAAKLGVIPHLQYFVKNNTAMKQFALPILCEMVHNSSTCRRKLWESNVLKTYLSILSDKYWQTVALDAIATWLSQRDEGLPIEDELVTDENMDLVINAVIGARLNFDTILASLHRMLLASTQVCQYLASSPEFIDMICRKLRDNHVFVRLGLLKVLTVIVEGLPPGQRKMFDQAYNLKSVLVEYSRADSGILVRESARKVIHLLN